jgi:hypothetical protein
MTKNRLQERDNNLPNVEYEALLKELLAVLKRHTDLFQVNDTVLRIQAESVALEVTNKLKNTPLADVRPFIYSRGVTHVTANFLDGEAFNKFRILIERLQEQLSSHLKTALATTFPAKNIEQYIRGLVSDPQFFVGDPSALHYPFTNMMDLKKRRLHLQALQKPSQSDTRFLGHKLTIAVREMDVFEQRLVDALCNQLEMIDDPPSRTEIERIRTVLQQRLQDENSEQGILKRVLRKESLGRLQKEAKIRYLEYLADAMSKKKPASEKGLFLLQTLARRLRMLEDFLHADKRDEDYQVSYLDHSVNYRPLFSRAEVLDLLPIFSDVEGTLGETFNKDKGEQKFVLGIKLKLNGRFRTYQSVFEYYLKLLDPLSDEHKERKDNKNIHRQFFIEKVLKLALLYYFVFKNMDNPTYNPAQDVEAELLRYLRGNDSDAQAASQKQKRLSWLTTGLSGSQYRNNLETLRTCLRDFVKSAGSEFELWPSQLYLSVSADILDLDEDRMRIEKKFFRSDALQEKGMGVLKYITIEDASAAGNSLCSVPISMTFEPMHYYNSSQEAEEQFAMEYNIRSFAFLPVIYPPNKNENLALCRQHYQRYNHIELSYAPTLPYTGPALLFIYHFTYLLLNYLCLKMISNHALSGLGGKQRLFLPLLRIHLRAKATQKEEKHGEEEFLHALSKTLAHLLCEQDALANAQGLHIDVLRNPQDRQNKSKLPNALSSLYSVLPKVFTLPAPPQLDHLAVIVVSSRKCDAHKDSPLHLSDIYGEVIGIRRYGETKRVQVVTLGTFSANETSDNMYRTPTVLQDQAKKCYERGYKHILYVAQAPYSSSLHLTSAETAEEQFFMSKSIIQSLKGGLSDLHIYPVYCDKFYVVKINGKIIESLYVDDTSELRSLHNDPNRSSVVFFNLLNGIIIGKDPMQRLYNGVVSYATLINVYDDPIYDQDIRNDLLDNSKPGSLKKDILDFLMLLHFARYERNVTNISFKLDPYDNIIGSDSVGTLSTTDHMEPGVNFNMLSFLTEVRSVLNRRYSGYVNTLLDEDKDQQDIETDKD